MNEDEKETSKYIKSMDTSIVLTTIMIIFLFVWALILLPMDIRLSDENKKLKEQIVILTQELERKN